MKHIIKYTLIILVAFASGIAGAYFFNQFQETKTTYIAFKDQFADRVHQTSMSQINNVPEFDFKLAANKSTRSVVYIKTTTANQVSQNWFDLFFNNGGGYTQQMVSSGSGVIFTENGYIVTNLHVIDKADKIEVILNKKTYLATLIGSDASTDLAVLKISGQNLTPIVLGKSKNLSVGEWVLAVGNPFNLNSTVTAGIVSAKGRNINVVKSKFPLESFIQTDAAINPGNSGGALVNIYGELVGINTAILSQTGSYAGYGFAVPVDIVDKVTNDIIEFGEVQKSFTGLELAELDDIMAQKIGLKDLDGVLVVSVLKESPASKVGIKTNDIIISIEGEAINSVAEYEEKIGYYRPGTKIAITFKRGTDLVESSLKLTNREGTYELLKRIIVSNDELGADFENVSKIEKQKLNIDGGVRILKVKNNSILTRMGIGEGFTIVSINKNAINSVNDLVTILKSTKGRVILEGIDVNGRKGFYSYYF